MMIIVVVNVVYLRSGGIRVELVELLLLLLSKESLLLMLMLGLALFVDYVIGRWLR